MSTVLASQLLLSPLPLGWSICFDTSLRYGVYLLDGAVCQVLSLGEMATSKDRLQVTYQIVALESAQGCLQIQIGTEIQSLSATTEEDWIVAEFNVANAKDSFIVQVFKTDLVTPIRAKISARFEGF